MLIPKRHGATDCYRYGFQGQEKDDEIKGEGNSLNFTFRMYDPRLGRFMSHDPLFKSFPWNSPYTISENRLIEGIDLEGGEFQWFMIQAEAGVYGKTVQKITRGVGKSIEKTVDGIVFVAQNPGDALRGTKDFVVGVVVKGSGVPKSNAEATLQYIDEKFDTNTLATNKAFESAIVESADKVVNGDLEDRTEVVTDVLTGILGAKGTDKIVRLGKFALLKKAKFADFPRITNKVKNDVQTNPEFGTKKYWSNKTEIKDGLIFKDGKQYSGASEYVVTTKGELILGKGHDFMSGNADEVFGAGKLYIEKGKIVEMTNETGHFRPTMAEMKKTLEGLRKEGVVDPKLKEPTDLYGN
ncbi:RHS repeat-associated core domain-containing protein [Winogradskyella sp. 3972H.M.0a.05]|uniref:RHS repeat domain-containing protein n=1 Tax=Winogradskyella sp. 3972H.M.0a.05 TaxID=2950277 RepID=UPI003392B73C